MKTPEQMAEEHANIRCPEQGPEFIVWCMCRDDFLAGYQAAKDQLADADKVMPEWISVKERLPEEGLEILWYHATGGEYCVGQLIDTITPPFFTHWMPLPEPPEGK